MANFVNVPNIERNLWRTVRNQNYFVDILPIYDNAVTEARGQKYDYYENQDERPSNRQKAPMCRFRESETERPEFPGISNCVTFGTNATRGRHAIASELINPCRTIAAVKSFAAVVDKTDEPYCLTCHEIQCKLVRCACQNAFFCPLPRTCREYINSHKYECGSQFHNIAFGTEIIVKCAIQMVFESLAIFEVQHPDGRNAANNAHQLNNLIQRVTNLRRRRPNGTIDFGHPTPTNTRNGLSRFDCIMQLSGIADDMERRTKQALNIIVSIDAVSRIFQNPNHRIFLQHLLMHFLSILRENSFETVFVDDIKSSLIFDTLSMFNHSCSPDLIHVFHGNKVYLVSTRRIPLNEELCISYIDFRTEDTRQRRNVLEEYWRFTCSCERCGYAGNNVNRRHSEITERDINKQASQAQNRFQGIERKIKSKFEVILPWDTTVGALGIAYKEAILDHINV